MYTGELTLVYQNGTKTDAGNYFTDIVLLREEIEDSRDAAEVLERVLKRRLNTSKWALGSDRQGYTRLDAHNNSSGALMHLLIHKAQPTERTSSMVSVAPEAAAKNACAEIPLPFEEETLRFDLTVRPYTTQYGSINVPKAIGVGVALRDYIIDHWNKVEFEEPILDYQGADFDIHWSITPPHKGARLES